MKHNRLDILNVDLHKTSKHNNTNTINCAKHLITRKAHTRKAYNRKSGKHINQTFVRKSCVKRHNKNIIPNTSNTSNTSNTNNTSNTSNTSNTRNTRRHTNNHNKQNSTKHIKQHVSQAHTKIMLDIDDRYISKFGYYDVANKTIDERHSALHKVINYFLPIKGMHNTYKYVISALKARYILQRNTDKKIAQIFKIDHNYISNEYKENKKIIYNKSLI